MQLLGITVRLEVKQGACFLFYYYNLIKVCSLSCLSLEDLPRAAAPSRPPQSAGTRHISSKVHLSGTFGQKSSLICWKMYLSLINKQKTPFNFAFDKVVLCETKASIYTLKLTCLCQSHFYVNVQCLGTN